MHLTSYPPSRLDARPLHEISQLAGSEFQALSPAQQRELLFCCAAELAARRPELLSPNLTDSVQCLSPDGLLTVIETLLCNLKRPTRAA